MNPKSEAIALRVTDDKNIEQMGENLNLFLGPKDLILPKHSIMIKSITLTNKGIVEITLYSYKIALYVVLSTFVEGNFDDNAFHMQPGKDKVRKEEYRLFIYPFKPFSSFNNFEQQKVHFFPRKEIHDITSIQKSLHIEHLGKNNYIGPGHIYNNDNKKR
jgi:hypothetical protein